MTIVYTEKNDKLAYLSSGRENYLAKPLLAGGRGNRYWEHVYRNCYGFVVLDTLLDTSCRKEEVGRRKNNYQPWGRLCILTHVGAKRGG